MFIQDSLLEEEVVVLLLKIHSLLLCWKLDGDVECKSTSFPESRL